MRESINRIFTSTAFGTIAIWFWAVPAFARDPVEVPTTTSIYTVEASYTAGGNDFVRAKVVIEFAHVPGVTFYSAQGWGPQQGERRWSLSPVHTSVPAEPHFPKAKLYFGNYVTPGPALEDIVPEGPLSMTSEDKGSITVESGPTRACCVMRMDSCNLISGSDTYAGIRITPTDSDSADHTVIQGNFIGTDATGMAALPNGQDGIDSSGGAKNDNVVSRSPRRLRF